MDELKNLLFLAPQLTQRNIATVAASAGFKVTFIEHLDDALNHYPHSTNILLVPEPLLNAHSDVKQQFISSAFSQFCRVVYDININEKTELYYLKHHISGVLSKSSGIDLSLKALMTLNSGEKWFSRQALEAAVDSLSFPHATLDDNNPPSINSNLSLKEKVTLELISHGLTNQEIAKEMQISENTVKAHISSLYRKTNCRNRVELTKLTAE